MATVMNRVDEHGTNLAAANDADGYRPTADEPFMSLRQQAYFRQKLQQWKDAILRESQETLSQLQVDSLREADLTDRASSGEYGYCEVTGEPISLARLEARPIATMTVEAQERHERNEKISRED
jgi:DnaK suppressor protein